MRAAPADIFFYQFPVMRTPFGRREFTLAGKVSKLIYHLCFNNVKDLLWVNVTAGNTLAFFAVYMVYQAFKVNNGINRVAIINRVAAYIQYHKLIEHFKDV